MHHFAYLERSIACVALLLLSACAIVPAPAGSTTGNLDLKRDVMFVTDRPASQLNRSAENSVRKLLTLQGYRVRPWADVSVIVSIAERSPRLAFEARAVSGQANSADAFKGEKHGGRISLCADKVYRLTVAFVDQRKGEVPYRGFAEQVSCDAPDENNIYNLAASATRSLRFIQ